MINIITGKPGSGKTLYLTMIAFEYYREGFPVYSNFYINEKEFKKMLKRGDTAGTITFFTDPEEFININGGLIVIDEIQLYFNSASWRNLPLRLQYKFQLHRHNIGKTKDGKRLPLDIWGTVQNVKRADLRIRELVNEIHHCKMMSIHWNRWNKTDFAMFVFIMDIDEVDKQMENIRKSSKWYLRFKRFYKCYDTFEIVGGKDFEHISKWVDLD